MKAMSEYESEVPQRPVERLDWRDDAACRDSDPDRFFSGSIDRARAVCDTCEVAADCLLYAIRSRTEAGVYGGMSVSRRKHIAKRVISLVDAKREVRIDRSRINREQGYMH